MTTHSNIGRPREFDTDLALDAALELFWTNGYRGTTTRQLEAGMGITQSSIYQAFGSKAQLLQATIDRYEQRVEAELLDVLQARRDGLDAIDAFLVALETWVADQRNRGCLVVNLMADDAGDQRIAARVTAYREKIRQALRDALVRSSHVDSALVDDRSAMLLASVLGLHIAARSGAQQRQIAAMVAGLRQQVADWRSA